RPDHGPDALGRRAAAVALHLDDRVADQPAANTGHEDGDERQHAGADRRQRGGPRLVRWHGRDIGHRAQRTHIGLLGCAAVRALIVLPTYNEAENIADVLRRVRAAAPDADVLVVDD